MSKKINLKFNGRDYVLEYTRTTALALEQNGFNLSDIKKKPANSIITLFHGAFLANHRRVSGEEIDRIFDSMKDKDKLLSALVSMYDETVSSLLEDSSDDEGNATWAMT